MSDPTATLTEQQIGAISDKISEIGPYQLLEVVGEGGMGAVYRAQQHDPIEREVAIKVTRLDLTSVRRLARFQAERQTLARLNHPNIATVYDAGETPDGYPYLVMEYLKGESLLEHCDRLNLGVEERLKLFVDLCHAIQFAHQQGVIHRDIKPSNVMVVQAEGRPLVKVIDFGIAKITGESSGHTMEGALLGTPAYMSPEQVRAPQDVDSRTDVYSLGLILYELLTGQLPGERRSRDNWAEVPRHPLPSPSQRLKTTESDEADALAAQRGLSLDALIRELKGDLDWVVLRSVQEAPADRYPGPSALAADIKRYVDNFPVEAKPPNRWDSLAKLVRRHRLETAAGVLLVLGLAAAVAVSTRSLFAAQEARTQAELEAERASAMNTFLVDVLTSPDPRVAGDGRETRVVDVLEQAVSKADETFGDKPLLKANMLETLGYTYHGLGDSTRGELLLEQSLALRRQSQGDRHPETLKAENKLLETQAGSRPLKEMEPRFADLFARANAVLPPTHPVMMTLYNNMGFVYMTLGNREDDRDQIARGLEFSRRSLEARIEALGPEAESTSHARNNLGNGLMFLDQAEEAEALFRENLEIQRRLFGEDNHYTLSTQDNLADALALQGRLDEAEDWYRKALSGMVDYMGREHPVAIRTRVSLAEHLIESGGPPEEAKQLAREVLELIDERPGLKPAAERARKVLATNP
ncbi:MAG: serine/threonine-protein kinase [Pseudomonadota bacterium]